MVSGVTASRLYSYASISEVRYNYRALRSMMSISMPAFILTALVTEALAVKLLRSMPVYILEGVRDRGASRKLAVVNACLY